MLKKILFFPYQLCLIVLFFLFGIWWGIGCYIASLFPNGEERARRYLVHWARLSLRLARLEITVAGLERLDPARPYVFMPNHSSFLDVLLVFAFIPHNFRSIAKKEMFSMPLFGLTVKCSGQIPLDRESPRKALQSIKQATELLKRGVSIVVFPEGTRSPDGKIHQFKTTLFVLPIRTRTPVVPVLIEGTFQVLRRGSLLLRRSPVKMTFLDPVLPDCFSDRERALYAEKVRRRLIDSSHSLMEGEKTTGACKSGELPLGVLALCSAFGLALFATPAKADLEGYVRKPEAEFTWKLKEKIERQPSGDRIYDLHLVSQNWQTNVWQHQLQVYQPRNVAPNATMFLWVTGGSARSAFISLGLELARKMRAPVAFLYHIPNQPLLESKLSEDDLIAETFVRYLNTKDENWPLLLPMVKSVVKAMDVLQAFGKTEWGQPIDSFIVSGASKRGWTTWLTAAVDARVRAIAPVVIDTLNMRAQMPRQLKAFGGYSARLTPYTSRGLVPIPNTPEGQRLLSMVDPWAYRERLVMPKLIINGTNDFYWATDALNLYWNELSGGKWVVYVPNAGHDLRRQDKPESEQLTDLINSLAAFSRHQITGRSMPALKWKHETVNGRLRLVIDATPAPAGARLWMAESGTQDFRTARWKAQALAVGDHIVSGEMTPPVNGHLAFYGQLDYEIDGVQYHLSTQVEMTKCNAELRQC
ncbi:MAG TPA: 1-acylglycerol-3-phosphate O-acyltransferase [Candidatus Binatia bacterium]